MTCNFIPNKGPIRQNLIKNRKIKISGFSIKSSNLHARLRTYEKPQQRLLFEDLVACDDLHVVRNLLIMHARPHETLYHRQRHDALCISSALHY